MKRIKQIHFLILWSVILFAGLVPRVSAQFNVEGDFRVRLYSDEYHEALDDRGTENYLRYLGRIRAKAAVNQQTSFYVEFITQIENNPLSPVRNIGGTGKMQYGISQIFAEYRTDNVPVFDLMRFRVGRQQFPIGQGLSQGDSYYNFDRFDAVRFDFALKSYTLSTFSAITEQNLSSTGLYPDPGSDQLHILRLTHPVMDQDVMVYYIYNKLRGQFNDSYIIGGGLNGDAKKGRLTYFLEVAHQTFNTLEGLPDKAGLGYMAGVSYRWTWGPFRSIKVETKYAAYQGDDADTREVEQFSPLYPSFFWGSRGGYVDGAIGGDYPNRGRNLEGSRIWYSRIYFIHKNLPKLRAQFHYMKVSEYIDNDNYNSFDDEVSMNLYYQLSSQTQVQLRVCRNFPNDDDKDLDEGGTITWGEDRTKMTRFMFEFQVKF